MKSRLDRAMEEATALGLTNEGLKQFFLEQTSPAEALSGLRAGSRLDRGGQPFGQRHGDYAHEKVPDCDHPVERAWQQLAVPDSELPVRTPQPAARATSPGRAPALQPSPAMTHSRITHRGAEPDVPLG